MIVIGGEWGEDKEGKGGQTYGDGRELDSRW